MVMILVVLAFVLFILASIPRLNSPISLGWVGMAALTLAYLLGHWPH